MTQYVHPDLEAIRDNPTADATINLVIVPATGRLNAVSDLVQQVDGEITEGVSLDMLKATLPETAVDTLAESPDIQAVHCDEELAVLTPGNP